MHRVPGIRSRKR